MVTTGPDRTGRAWHLCERGCLMLELGFRDLRPTDNFNQYLVALGDPPNDTEAYLCVVRGSVVSGRLA